MAANGTGQTKVPAIAFIGKSGSGKTTLVEKVIADLDGQGYKVGAVKHHGHRGFDIDVEGKDSWRMTQAGAKHTTIISPDRLAAYCEINEIERPSIEDIVNKMEDVDVVVIEGFRQSSIPSIELFRSGNPEDQAALSEDRDLFSDAVVTDMEPIRARAEKKGIPCYGFDDVDGIVAYIKENIIG